MSRGLPRRRVLALMGAALVERACIAQAADDALTPERFGAKGDGIANDTAAFAALAAEVMRRGGGEVVLRRTTYLVGGGPDGGRRDPFASAPPVFAVHDLPRALRIVGNGAVLRCAPGLRYGSFDPRSGRPATAAQARGANRVVATPYLFMISVERCAAAVEIADLELDGNSGTLRVGGPFGDVGTQVPATGLWLADNRGDEILRDIRSRNHALDGVMINGIDQPRAGTRRTADRVVCTDNGRQGCSLTGGRGWVFTACAFNRSARGRIASPPASGFDIEAEGAKRNRGHRFVDCEFVDNLGAGLVADTGDSADIGFTRCRFVGTSSPSIWPNKPGFVFDDCRITGTVIRCHGDADPARATRFVRCLFTDAPSASPTGIVFRQNRPDGSLADLAEAPNILFDHCRFDAVGGATLPWSTGAIYRDCTMRQTGRSPSYPRGRYEGRNVVTGPVILTGSRLAGQTIVNGARRLVP